MNVKHHGPYRPTPAMEKMLKDRSVSIIVNDFLGVDWHKKTTTFPNFVIYDSPTDFPGRFVVRLFDGNRPTRLIAVKNSLKEARQAIPGIFIPISRSKNDEPAIVETWL